VLYSNWKVPRSGTRPASWISALAKFSLSKLRTHVVSNLLYSSTQNCTKTIHSSKLYTPEPPPELLLLSKKYIKGTPQHNQRVVQWRLICPLIQFPLTWLYHYKHSLTKLSHIQPTATSSTPVRSQQPAGHKSQSETERVTTYFFRTSINRRSMVSHPFDPSIGRPQTVKRHVRAITNFS